MDWGLGFETCAARRSRPGWARPPSRPRFGHFGGSGTLPLGRPRARPGAASPWPSGSSTSGRWRPGSPSTTPSSPSSAPAVAWRPRHAGRDRGTAPPVRRRLRTRVAAATSARCVARPTARSAADLRLDVRLNASTSVVFALISDLQTPSTSLDLQPGLVRRGPGSVGRVAGPDRRAAGRLGARRRASARLVLAALAVGGSVAVQPSRSMLGPARLCIAGRRTVAPLAARLPGRRGHPAGPSSTGRLARRDPPSRAGPITGGACIRHGAGWCTVIVSGLVRPCRGTVVLRRRSSPPSPPRPRWRRCSRRAARACHDHGAARSRSADAALAPSRRRAAVVADRRTVAGAPRLTARRRATPTLVVRPTTSLRSSTSRRFVLLQRRRLRAGCPGRVVSNRAAVVGGLRPWLVLTCPRPIRRVRLARLAPDVLCVDVPVIPIVCDVARRHGADTVPASQPPWPPPCPPGRAAAGPGVWRARRQLAGAGVAAMVGGTLPGGRDRRGLRPDGSVRGAGAGHGARWP